MQNKRNRATLKDVAAQARVSVMTVSNVVNGRVKSVSPATRARIADLIQQLNYRPDSAARNLKLSRHTAIGMILLNENPVSLSDPFIANLTAGLSSHANKSGYSFVLECIAPEYFDSCPMIRNLQTDGLCVLKGRDLPREQDIVETIASLGQPIVTLVAPLPCHENDVCLVRQDDRGGSEALTRMLIDKGARRILFLSPALTCPAIHQRVEAAQAVCRHNGEVVQFDILATEGPEYDAVEQALADYLDRAPAPDAVMAGNDQTAVAALRFFSDRGLAVPEGVRVTGFNGFDFWRCSLPVLTTVKSPAFALGARAGEALLRRLETGVFAEREIVLPTSLMAGETT